ncbi:hypothetical protein VCCP10303_2405, partial [Vibrio cholerae CP1030(3)]
MLWLISAARSLV